MNNTSDSNIRELKIANTLWPPPPLYLILNQKN